MRTLKQLLGLCEHKWKVISYNEIQNEGYKIGMNYHLQCEKCGLVKSKKL